LSVGKRSDYERGPQGSCDTPAEAVRPLLPQLKPATRFIEPCCGKGFLVRQLKRADHVCLGRLRSARRRADHALLRFGASRENYIH
jgi:hypothetical protein